MAYLNQTDLHGEVVRVLSDEIGLYPDSALDAASAVLALLREGAWRDGAIERMVPHLVAVIESNMRRGVMSDGLALSACCGDMLHAAVGGEGQ